MFMRGDFTRLTFDPLKHYSRVMMQQGRVQLDADWNELVDMQLHFLRALAADLMGPHWGPSDSFKISPIAKEGNLDDLSVQPGHYYVDGILCESEWQIKNSGWVRPSYYTQPHLRLNSTKNPLPKLPFLVYLDVWERHVTWFEEENENQISIRESALRGRDTTTRTQIIWQLRLLTLNQDEPDTSTIDDSTSLAEWVKSKLSTLPRLSSGLLRARTKPPDTDDNPCLISPESRYRGAENQLYRVEIHKSGEAKDGEAEAATFKWSRENGSVIFPIEEIGGDWVTLEHLGRDSRFGLHPNDWVEIVDDDSALENRGNQLLQIKEIDIERRHVTLNASPAGIGTDATRHRFLRRWDQRSGASSNGDLSVQENEWLTLEDGVQIRFQSAQAKSYYRSGDYWLIPARIATGNVEWPGLPNNPTPLPPHGVEHHYAPLAIVRTNTDLIDLRVSVR